MWCWHGSWDSGAWASCRETGQRGVQRTGVRAPGIHLATPPVLWKPLERESSHALMPPFLCTSILQSLPASGA